MMACAAARFVLGNRRDQALGFLPRQELLTLNLRRSVETTGGIAPGAGHPPSVRKIEDATEEHQDAVSSSSSLTALAHFLDHMGDVLARDFIKHQSSERRQNVKSEVQFVDVPTSLVRLGMRQITVADELVKRWDGPQLSTASLRIGTKQRLGERRSAQKILPPPIFMRPRVEIARRLLKRRMIGKLSIVENVHRSFDAPDLRWPIGTLEARAPGATSIRRGTQLVALAAAISARTAASYIIG